MIRLINVHFGTGLALALGLTLNPQNLVLGQGPPSTATGRSQEWPRWENGGEAVAPAVALQLRDPAGDGPVFAGSVLGAAGGMAGGILAGVAVCWHGCGDDEYDFVVPVLLAGVATGGLGSVILGCAAAHEPGCTTRVLPKALLGTLVAVAGSVAVVSATDDALTGWITFSAIQGLLTARAIR